MKRFFLLTAIAGAACLLACCGKDKEPPVPVVSIGTQPTAPATALVEGSISGSLTIAATATEGAALTYQWFSNTTASNTGGTKLDGATSFTYTLPTTLTAGTYYYFCEVGAKGAVAVRSSVVTVTVNAPEPAISLAHPSHATQTAWADETHTGEGFTFTAREMWTAEVKAVPTTRASNVEWVRLMSGDSEKYDGAAGTHTLIVGLDPNYTGEDRAATVTLTAESGESIDVEITHAGTKEDGTPHDSPPTPTYTIGASPATLDFGSQETPYTQPAAKTVTVTNTGTGEVTLTAPTAPTGYTVGTLSSTTLAPEASATFTVRPDASLATGDHNGTITIGGSNGVSATVGVTFKVTSTTPPPPPTFVAVTDITGVPTAATVGTPLTLSATVVPGDATNKAITWTVASAGTTGATISGSTFNATATGNATVTATVVNGATASTPYTQNFTIEVSATPDTTPPTVTSVTPSGTGAAVGGNIVITFGEAMSTTPGTVQLNALPALSGGAWSVGNTVYTAAYADLANGTAYTVNISGFEDAAGNTMTADNTNSFTTVAAPGNDVGFGGENEVVWP